MQIPENIFCSIFPFITIFSFFRLDNFLWHDIHCCFPLSFPCFYLVHPVSSFHLPYILYIIFTFDSPLYLQIIYWDFSFFFQEQAQDLINNCRAHFFICFPLCNLPSILGFSWAPLLSSLPRELGFNHQLSGTLQWPCSHLWSMLELHRESKCYRGLFQPPRTRGPPIKKEVSSSSESWILWSLAMTFVIFPFGDL